jgi:predicted transcriptional regulator
LKINTKDIFIISSIILIMNARTSVLALLAVEPRSISDVARRLPFSSHTIYKAIEALKASHLIEKRRDGKGIEIRLTSNYGPTIVGRLVLKSISHGVDPEETLRPATIEVWGQLTERRTLGELEAGSGLSYHRVHRSLQTLLALGVVRKHSRRPLTISRVVGHPIGELLDGLLDEPQVEVTSLASSTSPVNVHFLPPGSLERILHDRPDKGFYITGADFQTQGDGRIDIYLSSSGGSSLEDFFLRLLETPEGVEDLCPQIVASGQLDYGRLVDLALEKKLANVVGVYLDVLGQMGLDVPEWALDALRVNVSSSTPVFPAWEERLPEEERREELEEAWCVDLRLDLGALAHGVRAL